MDTYGSQFLLLAISLWLMLWLPALFLMWFLVKIVLHLRMLWAISAVDDTWLLHEFSSVYIMCFFGSLLFFTRCIVNILIGIISLLFRICLACKNSKAKNMKLLCNLCCFHCSFVVRDLPLFVCWNVGLNSCLAFFKVILPFTQIFTSW